jgi:hypothetical protein
MSNLLLENSAFTVDLRSIYNPSPSQKASEPNKTADNTSRSDEVAQKLLELTKNNEQLVSKLMTLGEAFKNACKILGYKTTKEKGSNPILAFVLQNYVIQNLLNTGLLNGSSFKAIYNAVAKKLVADSEFFESNGYNLLYCKALYNKPAKEIEEYLTVQSKILTPTFTSYTDEIQLKNRRVFIEDAKAGQIPPLMTDQVKLNTISKARELSGTKKENGTVHRNSEELDQIVSKLKSTSVKFATIMALSTSTTSEEARKALFSQKFTGISPTDIADAFNKLSRSNVLPKGQLSETDADKLVLKILDTLEPKNS